MRYIINERLFMRWPPEGPLAAHVRPFGKWAFEQGYSKNRANQRVVLAAGFSQWLGRKGIRAREVRGEHPAQYLRHRWRQKQVDPGDNPSLKQFLEFLRRGGIVGAEKADSGRITPVGQCVREFETYLQDQRALALTTVSQYARYIRLFLTKRFGKRTVKLESFRAEDVYSFVRQESLSTHFTQAKRITTSLRSFFQFARYSGIITADLAAAVPKVAGWSMSGIPRAIAADEIRKLLSSIDRRHAKGRRDYAILLLLARLGLRSGEITRLDLDDIDWNSGSLKVRGKGRDSRLPLPQDVGEAIVAYLQHGRPTATSRRVFLRIKAPFRGFQDSTAIAGIVRYAIERAGVQSPTHGAHQFRHALARRCVMNTLRKAVQEYLTLRRSLGFKLREDGARLADFATFMEQCKASYITHKLALAWAQEPKALPSEWARRLGFVRVFARHRSATDPRTQISPTGLLPYPATRIRPYIYSDLEIRALLDASLKMRCRTALRPWTYYCLIGLLSVSGLRLGEALNLELQDVDLHAAVLTIKSGKFGKSRLVPLHQATRDVLADYMARRNRFAVGRSISSYLFVSSRGKRLNVRVVHDTFNTLSHQVGLRGPSDNHGPRLHDFRHRFAFKTLLNWYRSGKDAERLLPVLSNYLGHVHVSCTYWYLQSWPELMQEAMARLEHRWEEQP